MPEYQFANRTGKIITESYDRTSYLSPEKVLASLRSAFQLFPYNVDIQQVVNLEDVFHVTYSEGEEFGEIFICAKGTTPGGREGLKDEQRIQPKAKFLNYVYEKNNEGKKGVFLGVYSKDNQTVFCTWKVMQSNASSPETPISKQIKINSIAKAIKEGFVQHDKGKGEYACAFKPEFLYFYLRNSEWLHTGVINELANHTPPENEKTDILYRTSLISEYSYNRILFGAPGTGKSFNINQDCRQLIGNGNEMSYERVTFHPDYSYANFVGTYKPVMVTNRNSSLSNQNTQYDQENEKIAEISYEYVPGPFMRVYVKALRNAQTDTPKPFLLIIEEINRANVAAVFGDVFQLLDRDDFGVSEYSIQASEEIKTYLAKELGGDPENYAKIRLPNNMFIWATMNSADQGVFPMDTAFKRRWDFTYLGIDESDKDLQGKFVEVGIIEKQYIEWNELRKAINEFLSNEKINEDKQLGPYFIPRKIVVPENGGNEIDKEKFRDVFKHKVLMYLFDDAAKQKRTKLFEGSKKGQSRYSKLCEAFDEQGIGIFHADIVNRIRIRNVS